MPSCETGRTAIPRLHQVVDHRYAHEQPLFQNEVSYSGTIANIHMQVLREGRISSAHFFPFILAFISFHFHFTPSPTRIHQVHFPHYLTASSSTSPVLSIKRMPHKSSSLNVENAITKTCNLNPISPTDTITHTSSNASKSDIESSHTYSV